MVGDGAEVVQAACQLGFEGIVCKSRSAPYREGRGGAWLKVKCVQSDEFVVIAYTAGQGARAELGSLLLAQPPRDGRRSEEHTSELQSLLRSTYAVLYLTNKT